MTPSPRRSRFPGLEDAGERRRELIEELVRVRRETDLSQTEIAARMGTSQSAVARLESGELDARLSTLERYAAALGRTVDWRVRPAGSSTLPATPLQEPR
jgi:transcriptional regulator with XRE-family HTH domain